MSQEQQWTSLLCREDFRAVFQGRRKQWSAPELLRATLHLYLGHGCRAAMWTSSVLEAMTAFGVTPAAARQALARASEAGSIETERVGNRVRWRFSDQGRGEFDEARTQVRRDRATLDVWDGRWSLIAVLSPIAVGRMAVEQRPDVRLQMLGYGQLQDGLWVSPHAAREKVALEILRTLPLRSEPVAFLATARPWGGDSELVARAWDVPGLADAFADFIGRFSTHPPQDDSKAFAHLVHVDLEWPYLMRRDPVLPKALLPRGWVGQRAIRLHERLTASWQPRALRWLDRLA